MTMQITKKLPKSGTNSVKLIQGEVEKTYYRKFFGKLFEEIIDNSIKDKFLYNNLYIEKEDHYIIRVYVAIVDHYYDVLIDKDTQKLLKNFFVRVNTTSTGKAIDAVITKSTNDVARKTPIIKVLTDDNWDAHASRSADQDFPEDTYGFVNGNVLDLRRKNIIEKKSRDAFRELLMTIGAYKGEDHFNTYYKCIQFDEHTQCITAVVTDCTGKKPKQRYRKFPIDWQPAEASIRLAIDYVNRATKRYKASV